MPPNNLPTQETLIQQKETSMDVSGSLGVYVPRIIIGVVVVLLVVVSVTFLGKKEALAPAETRTSNTGTLFDSLTLEGQSAIVWDAKDDRMLFGREQDRVVPLASVSKVMTALAAAQGIPQDAVISISQTALATEGDSGLILSEHFTRDNLISFMLVTSSNDAATALREHFDTTRTEGAADFIWHMNDIARDLGLMDMVYVNPSGLDEVAGAPVNRGSARSVAKLFAYAIQTIPNLIDTTRFTSGSISSREQMHQLKNTNTIIDDIPLAIGSKTGFTDSAGGNLALSFDATIGHPIIIVVLGSSREGRFSDMKKLITKTREYLDADRISTGE